MIFFLLLTLVHAETFNKETMNAIIHNCEQTFPNDFFMQETCMKKQFDAWHDIQKIKNFDYSKNDRKK